MENIVCLLQEVIYNLFKGKSLQSFDVKNFGDFARIAFFDKWLASTCVLQTAEKVPCFQHTLERHASSESSGSLVYVCKVS